MKSFHELKVWRNAHELTLAVYRATAKFPREELYGLQVNSAALVLLFPLTPLRDAAAIATLTALMRKLRADRHS